MPGNTFGHTFRITTWGESHGKALGVVIDGCPSKIKLSESDIQKEVNKRKSKSAKVSTPRKETDKVVILSGVFEGKTTGTPISILIENKDARSKDYTHLKNAFREGHADKTYQLKYGIRDYRGGGRASGRETVSRVIAGAIAKKILPKNVKITGEITQVGKLRKSNITIKDIGKYIEEEKLSKNSCGGVVEITVKNPPAGLGEPVFDKLDAELAKALMSIGAVKGVEIGAGFRAAEMKGSENVKVGENHAGGILGGISDGNDIKIRIAVKPTPSIGGKGRHDKCIVPRIVIVAEAMTAIVLADHLLRNQTY
ncbi:MAG: chorismate synthase [Patescibacteria group bacterium]|nr:chorismate synthase [Patescibacteria group bacterium]